jgi:hypothetical protein
MNSDRPQFRYEANCLRFRKVVIAIIAVNRLRKKPRLDHGQISHALATLLPKQDTATVDHLVQTVGQASFASKIRTDISLISFLGQGNFNLSVGLKKHRDLPAPLKRVFNLRP